MSVNLSQMFASVSNNVPEVTPAQVEEVAPTPAPAPARRGRRPKAVAAAESEQACECEDTKKEKRGKGAGTKRTTNAGTKAKAVYDVAVEGAVNDVHEEETVIIKLDVQADMLQDQPMFGMDDAGLDGPFAFNGFSSCGLGMYSHDLNDLQHQQMLAVEPLPAPMPCNAHIPHASLTKDDSSIKAIRLLMDFDEKCKNGEWPASTSVHCYWCCHRFQNVPIGIPLTYNEDIGKFMVYGCFCSCECAAAYNLDSKESSDEILTRHAFLNMLARELGHTHLVKPAPSRLVLNMFGGPMSIEEFRGRCHTSRLVLVNFPPMMTVTQQVEEINQRELRSEYRYIPIDSERVNKYKEKIKLRRSKPLVNFKNTLDHTMNLKFA